MWLPRELNPFLWFFRPVLYAHELESLSCITARGVTSVRKFFIYDSQEYRPFVSSSTRNRTYVKDVMSVLSQTCQSRTSIFYLFLSCKFILIMILSALPRHISEALRTHLLIEVSHTPQDPFSCLFFLWLQPGIFFSSYLGSATLTPMCSIMPFNAFAWNVPSESVSTSPANPLFKIYLAAIVALISDSPHATCASWADSLFRH